MPERLTDPIALAHQNWVRSGWVDAADGMFTVTSLIRAQQILMARIEATLKPFGVSFARYELLRLLGFASEQKMTMGRARSLLQVHPASISGVVDRLEADGLVRRSAHPDDGRSVVVEITDTGRDLTARATAVLNADVFESLGLTGDEVAYLGEVLTRFRRNNGDATTS